MRWEDVPAPGTPAAAREEAAYKLAQAEDRERTELDRVVLEARWMQLVGQLNERFPLADGQQWAFDAAPIPGLAPATFTTSGWYDRFVADLLVDATARWADIRRARLSRMRSLYRARHR